MKVATITPERIRIVLRMLRLSRLASQLVGSFDDDDLAYLYETTIVTIVTAMVLDEAPQYSSIGAAIYLYERTLWDTAARKVKTKLA